MKIFSKVKAGFWTGIVVAAIVAGCEAGGLTLSPTAVAVITTVVSSIFAWLKIEKVGYVKS